MSLEAFVQLVLFVSFVLFITQKKKKREKEKHSAQKSLFANFLWSGKKLTIAPVLRGGRGCFLRAIKKSWFFFHSHKGAFDVWLAFSIWIWKKVKGIRQNMTQKGRHGYFFSARKMQSRMAIRFLFSCCCCSCCTLVTFRLINIFACISLLKFWHPTNNALLTNFRLSSNAEILLISTGWAYKLAPNVQKRVCNVYIIQLSFHFAYHRLVVG